MRSFKAVGRLSLRVVPGRIRKSVDDRFFYAVFNLTRVTNDHYPMRARSKQDAKPEGSEDSPG